MAYDIYKGGAWQPPDNVQKYEAGAGAWKDAEAVHRYKDGAWQEVWSNVKIMAKKSDNITTGMLRIQEEGLKFHYLKFATEQNGTVIGTLGGGGEIVFYLDGDWTDPNISLDWLGGFIYQSTDGSYNIRVSAGDISVYTRASSGRESTQRIVGTIGSTLSGADGGYVGDDQGQYVGTIPGTFDRVGLSIRINDYGETLLGSSFVEITNLLIDGRKIGFPQDAEFDRQDWG